MANFETPSKCPLCNGLGGTSFAGFHQVYRQLGGSTVYLKWWKCNNCRGWFVHPVPTPETIVRNCCKASYNDPSHATGIAQAKESLQRRILKRLSSWTTPGPLLDFGCSFGDFLILAREAGWTPSGFDPNEDAVKTACAKGFDVRSGWELETAGFPEKDFAAITAIDSFCFAWQPHETLQLFHRLLKPGGILAMRLTNKRFILGLMRALFASGAKRDATLSRILKGQFHTISIHRLSSILRDIGYDRLEVEPWAMTAPWRSLSAQAKWTYGLAQLIYMLTLKKVNLSPGVLLFARKAE